MRHLILLLLAAAGGAFASANADSVPVKLDLSTATVGGTLLLPRTNQPYSCIVIVGGTLSQLRDGELLRRPEIPQRTALKRLAESLATAGYGSFRYDQIGEGESRAKTGYRDLYAGDAQVLADIYKYLRGRSECSKILAAGESAGACIASLAARAGAQADAYLFLGGFCGKVEEIFEYNFDRLHEYVGQNAERAAWARASNLDREMAFGLRWRDMFAAAHAGRATFKVAHGTYKQTVELARRREEIDNPPDDMYAYIKAPALALAGTRDLNVAPHHAACPVAVMQRAGNLKSQAMLIDGADHNFQIAPDDSDLAFRERYTFASFNRPYHPQLDHEIFEWLHAVAPVEPKTPVSPERFHLAPGLTLIDDIMGARKEAGVDTLEGFIGPLLRTPGMRAHFIDMPAGLYLDEHPHAKGSIIYTVRGQWALNSLGRYILIFKAIPGDDDEKFITYLRSLATNLKQDQAAGTPFRLVDLPPTDPAHGFAQTVNPRFEQEFPSKHK